MTVACVRNIDLRFSQPSSVSTITSLPPPSFVVVVVFHIFFLSLFFPRCRRRLYTLSSCARWARFRENVRDVSVSRPAYPLPNKNNPTHLAESREQRISNLNWTHRHKLLNQDCRRGGMKRGDFSAATNGMKKKTGGTLMARQSAEQSVGRKEMKTLFLSCFYLERRKWELRKLGGVYTVTLILFWYECWVKFRWWDQSADISLRRTKEFGTPDVATWRVRNHTFRTRR